MPGEWARLQLETREEVEQWRVAQWEDMSELAQQGGCPTQPWSQG